MEETIWRTASDDDAKKIRKKMKKQKRSPARYLILAGIVMFVGLTVHTLRIRLSGTEVPGTRNVFITVCYALIAAVIIVLSIQSVRAGRKNKALYSCFIAEGICLQKQQKNGQFLLTIRTDRGEKGLIEVTKEVYNSAREGTGIKVAAWAQSGSTIVGQMIL